MKSYICINIANFRPKINGWPNKLNKKKIIQITVLNCSYISQTEVNIQRSADVDYNSKRRPVNSGIKASCSDWKTYRHTITRKTVPRLAEETVHVRMAQRQKRKWSHIIRLPSAG